MKINESLFIFLSLSSFICCGQTDKIAQVLESRINHNSENPIHNILIQIDNLDKKTTYSGGFGTKDKDLQLVSGQEQFKTASSTKLFVSTIILLLNEEGKLDLNDKASKFLKHLDFLNFDNLHIHNKKNSLMK